MTSSATFPPILVFDAVSGEYRDPSDSADTTAKVDAPTKTVLVTGGTYPRTHIQNTTHTTNSPAKQAVSSAAKCNSSLPVQDGKPLAQASTASTHLTSCH